MWRSKSSSKYAPGVYFNPSFVLTSFASPVVVLTVIYPGVPSSRFVNHLIKPA